MHPLSEELQEVRFGKRAGPGIYAGWPEWEQRAADALDAYHEALDGCEVVGCKQCAGAGWILRHPCSQCLGTGKRLQKREV